MLHETQNGSDINMADQISITHIYPSEKMSQMNPALIQ